MKSPIYATGVGLVLYGTKNVDKRYFRVRDNNVYEKITNRMRAWLGEIF